MSYLDKVLALPKKNFGTIPENKTSPLIVEKLLNELGVLPFSFKTIHVAGTNGKGSVCTKVALSLSDATKRVGLFTSPHLLSFYERISIIENEILPISQEEFEDYSDTVWKKYQLIGESPNFFDFITALSLFYFAKKKVSIAVIETGIGGRYDPTNVVDPILSIITSIGYDHQNLLGSSLEQIAWHKAGIIKSSHLIIGPTVIQKTIHDEILLKKVSFEQVDDPTLDYDDENEMIAKKALNYLKTLGYLDIPSNEKAVRMNPRGRFDRVTHEGSDWILDVAHNLDGIKKLFDKYQRIFPDIKPIVIFSVSSDKDYQSMTEILYQISHHLIAPRINDHRALDPDLFKLSQKFQVASNVKQAIEIANNYSKKHKLPVVVCGSFLIVREVIKTIQPAL